ncbi:hypothetical protein ACFXA3_08505 [Streptomyces sp. NPDC059456]|uniref:hypothetical protein n=1 Tax=Streptomyces sp. NPDC059456 TaxID=3346838 RepID=UPI003696AB83
MHETEQLPEQVARRAHSGAGGPGKPLPAPPDAAQPARAALIPGSALPPLLAALHPRAADGGIGPEGGPRRVQLPRATRARRA